MDWTLYWFMFPVGIGVATIAMLSGIAGTALFIPLFVVVFPALGPDYPLTTAAAIGTSLVTALFGFTSGFVGYQRKGLIDFRGSLPFILVAVPFAIAGALLLANLKSYDALLKGTYGALMLLLCPVLLRKTAPPAGAAAGRPNGSDRPQRTHVARDGRTFVYRTPRQGHAGIALTGTGAFLTGLLGVGIGEVIMPQLVKRARMALPVAAGTSVFIVMVTLVAASFTQVSALAAAGGIDAIPWNLVCYSAPGVVVGGQIGPWLQGYIQPRTTERLMAALLALIGVAMLWIALR